jgi:DNA-binding transcriptional MocR family regulator
VDEITAIKGSPPRLIYLIPTGLNPQGFTMSQERRDEIYSVCKEKDLIIIEDDAYFYLHLGEDGTPLPGLKGLPRSFLARDADGRVIRLDSFSKSFCPGSRMGWLTASPDFVEKYQLLAEANTQGASGFSQTFLFGLLDSWKQGKNNKMRHQEEEGKGKDDDALDGFEQHITDIQGHYRHAREAMVRAANDHVADVMEWQICPSGMFIWFKVKDIVKADGSTQPVCTQDLFPKLIEEKVLMVPGRAFSPSDLASPYLRATFASASTEEMDEAFRRIRRAIDAFIAEQEG